MWGFDPHCKVFTLETQKFCVPTWLNLMPSGPKIEADDKFLPVRPIKNCCKYSKILDSQNRI